VLPELLSTIQNREYGCQEIKPVTKSLIGGQFRKPAMQILTCMIIDEFNLEFFLFGNTVNINRQQRLIRMID